MRAIQKPMTLYDMIRLTALRTLASSALAGFVAFVIGWLSPGPYSNTVILYAIAIPFFVTPFLSWMTAAALRDARAAQIRADELAYTDSLTGALNRRAFFEANAPTDDAAAHTHRRAILFIDIDNFKAINDAHGHEGGDAVLRSFAKRLQVCVRKSDLVVRFGGEEFVVEAEDLLPQDAEKVAQRISRAAREDCVPFRNETIRYSVSIGVTCGDATSPIDQLLAAADAQLYLAKNAGRDCIRSDGAGMTDAAAAPSGRRVARAGAR